MKTNKIASLVVCLCIVFVAVLASLPMFTLTASAEDGTWTLVTDASTLKAGDKIVIAAFDTSKGSFVAGSLTSQYLKSVSPTFSADGKTITNLHADAVQLTLGGSSGSWTLAKSSGELLGATAVKKLAWGSGTTTWSISISNGNATIQNATSSYGRFLYNVSSPRFTTYTSSTSASMVLPQIYRFEAASVECDSTQYTTATIAPTCTTKGYTTYTCTVCENHTWTGDEVDALGHDFTEFVETKAPETEKQGYDVYKCSRCDETENKNFVDALGYVATFVTPDGTSTDQALNVELPVDVAVPAGNDGYTFAGWAKEELTDASASDFVLYTGTVKLSEDTTFYAVFKKAGEGADGWVKKDIASIQPNDIVVITVTKSGTIYAMSNDNGTTSGPSPIVFDAVTAAENIKWNIGGDANGYIFYPHGTTETWLYCISDNNGVRVGNNEDNTFVVDATTGYLKHTGTSRYLGVYNTQDWRCYKLSSGSIASNIKGQTLAFYVLESSATYTTGLTEQHICTETKITGASINIGDTLAMEYHVSICSCQNADDYTMNFTMNGNAVNGVKYNKVVDGNYVFTFSNIAPQCMGDNIAAELVYNSEVVAEMAEYSVKANAAYLLATYSNNAKLVALVNDLLNYGAAAQEYRNYNTDNLVTDEDTTADVKPESTDMTLTESTDENAYFTAAGVYFDYNNKIYVKFVGNATVKINEVEVEAENGVVYTDAISATQFANVYTFELVVDGEVVQTLTYSVNSYAYAKWGTDGELTAMQKLARALYAYGKSSEGYNA